MSSVIDLSLLPAPQSVEQIAYEQILTEMLTDLRSRAPEYSTISEADPAYKVLEICAYREVMLRQRENNKVKGLLLAFATGADLDHLGATYFNGTQRLVVTAANNSVVPPIAAVLESDDDYRRRLLLQPEGDSIAGPEGAYVFHAISAHAEVIDASAYSPWPAGVVISVLGINGLAPTTAAMQAVADKLSAAAILPTSATAVPAADDLTSPISTTSGGLRPVADRVIIRPATLISYTIDADVVVPTGPDASIISTTIATQIKAYKDAPRRLGRDVALSAIYAALHIPGVERVDLNAPLNDIELDLTQATVCTAISIRVNGQEITL